MVKNTIKEFFEQDSIKDILKKYENANKQAKRDIGLNIFRLVSDYYYRENFHGDILNLFLDPKSELSESKRFSHLFLEMVLTKAGNQKYITEYDSTNLEREYHIEGKRRIDFVIKGHESKSTSKRHCIIIENKLYDAVDMDNQIPAYKEAMEGRGYVVDAIVYLPLSEHKVPDRSTWKVNTDKIDEIDKILCVIPAQNLIDDWLKKCSQEPHNCEETQVILKHYINLLNSLLPIKNMEKTMDDFLDFIKNSPESDKSKIEENISKINTICELRSNFKFRQEENIFKKITEQGLFKNSKIVQWDWCHCVIKIPSVNDTIYVQASFSYEDAYKVCVVINDNWRGDAEYSERGEVYKTLKMTWSDEKENGMEPAYRFVKTFNIDEESDLIRLLAAISQKSQ